MKIFLVVLLFALVAVPPVRVVAQTPLEINAILSLTGSAAFLGKQQVEALTLAEDVVNNHGGVRGQPIHFSIADDQSSPQVAVQLMAALAAKHVPVVLGSTVASTCSAMAPLVEKSGPLEYCASPVFQGSRGSYVFSASTTGKNQALVAARFCLEHGWKRVAIIALSDASGQNDVQAFSFALEARGNHALQLLANETFNQNDISVAAQVARIKSAHPDVVMAYATGTAVGTVLRGFHDAAMNVPIVTSAGNMQPAQMAQYVSFLPTKLFFIAPHGAVPDPGLQSGPIKDAQDVYFAAFRSASIRPGYADILIWDPAMIIVETLRHTGSQANATQVRAYIEQLHNWAGIMGMYDFRDGDQRGLGQDVLVAYGWSVAGDEPVVASKSGGRL